MTETSADQALLALLSRLDALEYDFVTPLNPTSELIRERRRLRRDRDLRDVLGWSLPFESGTIAPEIEGLLQEAGVLRLGADGYQSSIRVSRLDQTLFLHSAFGASEPGTVFLGPDSYRFAEFLRVELADRRPVATVVEIGAGAGVGGIVAGRASDARDIHLGDINTHALRLARLNAAHAGLTVAITPSDGMAAIDVTADLIVANPPFIAGSGRTYSDGGDLLGGAVSLDWARQAMARLSPGGRLLLYTGAAIVAGKDRLSEALKAAAEAHACDLRYRELDPDIFGEELRRPAYAQVERIAAVAAVATRA